MYLDPESGLQCINSTLLWNGTNVSTNFNHSSGFNFTDCGMLYEPVLYMLTYGVFGEYAILIIIIQNIFGVKSLLS